MTITRYIVARLLYGVALKALRGLGLVLSVILGALFL